MRSRPFHPIRSTTGDGVRPVYAMAVVGVLLVGLAFARAPSGGSTGGSTLPGSATTSGPPSPALGPSGDAIDLGAFLLPSTQAAAPIHLTDQDGRFFDLASLRGSPVLVFFGYTHCPDVCPATVGTVGLAMEAFGSPVRAIFVTVDPERDTPAALGDYVRYLAHGFIGLTGLPSQIAATAAGWGVSYGRVDTGRPGAYSMSHTADVFLVDANGVLRARFPFGTSADAMTATLVRVAGSPVEPAPAQGATTVPVASPTTAGGLDVVVISSSIWSGPAAPIILALGASGSPLDDSTVAPEVQLIDGSGLPAGSPVAAVGVQPPGESRVVYVADVAIPAAGPWRLSVTVERGGIHLVGSAPINVLDPGGSAAIGGPAPAAHTPTLEDVGGVAKAITTDPAPDLRLSGTSTTDALAAHRPFVLVIDSSKFRVTSACGRALVMARYLVDRWPDVAFIHLEPLRYDVVTDTPVLEGTLEDPTLTDAAAAWGLGAAPWGARAMPWIFVVDGNGIVRSKSEGVMGSDDVDVIVAVVAAGH